jgi:hypothetical protein
MMIFGWFCLVIPLTLFTVFTYFVIRDPFGGHASYSKWGKRLMWGLLPVCLFFWYQWLMWPYGVVNG